jgi:hypothetical protein
MKFSDAVTYRGLTFLVQQLLVMVDSGAHDDVTVPQTLEHIRDGDLFTWLKSLDESCDFSAFGVSGPYREATTLWLQSLEDLREHHASDIRRKWGIENRGLCLLVTWTFEILRWEVDRITAELRDAAAKEPQSSMH